MANVAYLTVEGKEQGLISAGCNSIESIGQRFQLSHTDEITVISCNHGLYRGPGFHKGDHSPLVITKIIDKSSPLLATAWGNEELLECKLNFYRTAKAGNSEQFYSILLKGAKVSSIHY